jgi:hypothetical protein
LKKIFKELSLSSLRGLTNFSDRLLFILMIASAVLGFLYVEKLFPSGSIARIYADNKPVYSLSLDEDRVVPVAGPLGNSYVEVKDGRVRMKDSPCPLKVCVQQGWTDRGSITCLPNKVVVSVTGNDSHGHDTEYDAITK